MTKDEIRLSIVRQVDQQAIQSLIESVVALELANAKLREQVKALSAQEIDRTSS